ncbi:hypothetical protein MKZ38_010650 [Zalerion maritima]|uniref:Acyltransferase 3 domain-containing protein n=1 Tax=Zalerion maritima TaxID=339359 RepID=A0AAD5RT82_9PEZI|nr:hypothetical protein MKZ38_010650 [Zalerion maritima]
MPAAPGTKGVIQWIEDQNDFFVSFVFANASFFGVQQGLRGLVSVFVVVTHVSRAWDYSLFFPRDSSNATPRLLQLPILRVPPQGRIGVPLFAFLTGFVCAAKPLRLAYQQDQQHAAVMSMARSAFRRPIRLMLPAALATFCSFLMSIVGGYKAANRCDSQWVRFDAPGTEPFGTDLARFLRTLITTWTDANNPYDRHQWAMKRLLIGAFQVYGVLIVTMGMRFRYRIMVNVTLLAYWWLNRGPFTETFGAPLVLGTLVAELGQHQPTQSFIKSRQRLLTYFVAPVIIILGLYLGSYPQEHEDWALWSRHLEQTFVRKGAPEGQRGSFLVPEGTSSHRRFSSIGVMLVITGLFLAPRFQDALANKYLQKAGQYSFAVYLVHGTILRTIGVWIIYGISGEPWTKAGKNPDGSDQTQEWIQRRGPVHVFISIVVFIVLTYSAAYAWVRWVDSTCARITLWLEAKMFPGKDADSNASQEKQLPKPNQYPV